MEFWKQGFFTGMVRGTDGNDFIVFKNDGHCENGGFQK
jgi:hypothetical protein